MAGNALFRTMNRMHVFLYRRSGGRILGKIVGSPVLLLTTTGRKTGRPRTVPLVFAWDGRQYAVIATDAPAWHRNLQSNPQASIEIKGQVHQVIAHDAAAQEAAGWWERIIKQSPAFKNFRDKPSHRIVILDPQHQIS